MPAPLRLFLVRHGQVASNRELRFVGERDEGLTAQGQEQAEALGRIFRQIPVDGVLSSPLRRCAETAERLGAGAEASVRIEERLREQSFGSWEGLSRDEVLARSAEDAASLRAWERDSRLGPPGGESLLSVQERVLELIGELARDPALGPGASVVLVSHVGPIKTLLAAGLDLPLERARRIFLDPGTVSIVDWGEPPVFRLVNAPAGTSWLGARWMQADRKT